MIQLDHQLVFEARRLMTGADVHRVEQMIFVYEQAVDLHNNEWPSHQRYQVEHEARLRNYVIERRLAELNLKIAAARQYSAHLSETSDRLHARSEELDALYDEWKYRQAA